MAFHATPGDARLNTAVATSPTHRVLPAVARYDAIDGGGFSISGTVYLKGPPQTPVPRRVRLHDRATGRPVRETWSTADGHYEFTKIAAGLYYVVTFDHTNNFNAVIADRIVAV